MELATEYLERFGTGMLAYVSLQNALVQRFVARGGTKSEFVERLAPAFARRYRFMYTGTPS